MQVYRTFFGLWCLVMSGGVAAAEHCVVLQYHHFSETTPPSTSVTPARFAEHLRYLREQHYQVLPLQDVITKLRAGEALPERCVSLSVDDAYLSVYQTAYPMLQELGWPLSIFISTEGVDQGLDAYMSWEQMREMARAGVRFENHSHSHAHLIRRLPDESVDEWQRRVTRDIQQAQQRITEELGQIPTLIAYPYGEYSPDLQRIVTSLGLTGFGQQSGPIGSDSDFTALPRFPMAAGFAEMSVFRTKVDTLTFPLLSAEPTDPLVPLEEWRPVLTLKLRSGSYSQPSIHCFINGSDAVELSWPSDQPDTLFVRPGRRLPVGRSRTNCTMPSATTGRFHWYSHNWIRREADGSWYRE